MKFIKTSTILAFTLSTYPHKGLSQEEGDLCANMVFSAAYKDLTAPSLQLLQAQCSALCGSARNYGINTFGPCALGGVSDIEVQNFNLIRWVRCSERCTGQTAFSGDCGCTVSANDVLVESEDMMVEGCAADVLVYKVFFGFWLVEQVRD